MCPPSDTHLYPTRECLDGDPSVGVVREAHAEFGVELRLVCRVGVREHVDDVAQGLYQRSGLGLGGLGARKRLPELCLSGLPSRSTSAIHFATVATASPSSSSSR